MLTRDPNIAPELLRQPLARALAFCLTLCARTLALLAQSVETPNALAAPSTFPASISFQTIATGLSQPVHVTNAGDGSGRLFIVERAGRIRIYNGSLLATPFLNITVRVLSSGPEQGLLSVAFPPNYGSKLWFYVYYVDLSGNLQISRFRTPVGTPDVADANSEQKILNIPHPGQANHNGGQLQFGRDGFLYLAPGDGGGGGDQFGTIGHGQDLTQLLGKILRINVEPGYNPNPPSGISFTQAYTVYLPFITTLITPPVTYTIPITNPFTSTIGARGEVWAYGLRNPWRFSFDRLNGDLFIGDVGQNCWEEIDYTPAISSGVNFGWRITEGFHGFDTSNFNNCSFPDPNFITLTKPITAYDHSFGNAVIGGYIYRGSTYSTTNPMTNLYGTYLFSDEGSGRFWGAQFSVGVWATKFLTLTSYRPSSFGEDQNGELYFVDYAGGGLYQVKTP